MRTHDRFMGKVTQSCGECWEWNACRTVKGYGQFRVDGKTVPAHRWSYEWFVGPIPEGLQIDHLCRNPGCVNPDHLEAVTSGENTRRGISANRSKTHCLKGHEFTLENTYAYRGRRRCRACHADRMRKRQQRAA